MHHEAGLRDLRVTLLCARGVAALARASDAGRWAGTIISARQLADAYGITDTDGSGDAYRHGRRPARRHRGRDRGHDHPLPGTACGRSTTIHTTCPGCSSAGLTAGSPARGSTWTKVPAPFGELAWDHVSGQLAGEGRSGAGELERARAVDDLLRRAYHGPPGDPAADAADTAGARRLSARDRRVAARTRATTAPRRADSVQSADATVGHAMPAPAGTAAGQHDDGPVAKVIPLGIFDPFEEAKKRR